MPSHVYHHVETEGGASLTVFLPDGDAPLVLTDTHPNFAAVLEAAREGVDPGELRELADLTVAVARRFDRLSERVAVANGRVYFDGDEIDNSISRQIRRCLDEGVGDWRPLVWFLEKLASNPQEHSREQLYRWLADRDFTITADGSFIGYKGVASDGEGGYQSVHAGPAVVDGDAVNGNVPNNVGSVVEMPRSSVAFDPAVGCSTGLHVGTYKYAHGYASGALLKVKVNPRDVVSVPTDSGDAKLRVCRYEIVETIDAPETAPVVYDDDTYALGEPDGDLFGEGSCEDELQPVYAGDDAYHDGMPFEPIYDGGDPEPDNIY